MKYKDLHIGKTVAINQLPYKIIVIVNFGHGPMYGCSKYVLEPTTKNLPCLQGVQWHDGEIHRFTPELSN